MIRAEMGRVDIDGTQIELLADLSIIVCALNRTLIEGGQDEDLTKQYINHAVELGFDEKKEETHVTRLSDALRRILNIEED